MWKAGGKARIRSGREEAEKKGSTGGTAVGAKPGGMKGNEQKAKYQKPERRHGKPGGREGGKRGSRKEEPKHWRSHCEAGTGRRERKSRGLSSQNRKVGGRKKAGPKGERPKAKAEGKHSWNSCGSEARKGERKRTGSRVRRTGKESTGNRAGENGGNRGSESRIGHRSSHCEAGTGRNRKGRNRG